MKCPICKCIIQPYIKGESGIVRSDCSCKCHKAKSPKTLIKFYNSSIQKLTNLRKDSDWKMEVIEWLSYAISEMLKGNEKEAERLIQVSLKIIRSDDHSL